MKKTDPQKKTKNTRRLMTAALCGALAFAAVAATPRPAQAMEPLTVGAFIAYLQKAYGAYKTITGLLGGSGPSLAAQLAAVQEAIISEMRTERNMALQSRTRSIVRGFINLADNSLNDPTNDELWNTLFWEGLAASDEMHDIIFYANDPSSAYQLAPAYNTLLTTGTGILRIKGELWPATPSSWNDFYTYLYPGMQANYKNVGSQRHQCYPGYNPGYKPPPPFSFFSPQPYADWVAMTRDGKFRSSQLWKKLENRSIHVETWKYICTFIGQDSHARTCNPVTRTCNTLPGDAGCSKSRTVNNCNSGESLLDCADRIARGHFNADAMVQITREGMIGINRLSGGNDYDWATNDWHVPNRRYVDPWVDEPSCGTAAPWAYAQLP